MAAPTTQPVYSGNTPVPAAPTPTLAGALAPAATQTGAINLSQYASQYPASVIAAAQQIFSTQPDQAQAFQSQYGGNLQAWLNSFTQWWSNYGSSVAGNMAQYAPEANLLSALGYQQGAGGNWVAGPNAIVQAPPLGSTAPGSNANPTTNLPAEEGIYNEVIPQINQEVLNDANLAQTTQQLQTQNQANYGTLGNVLAGGVAPAGGLSAVTTQENQAAAAAANTQLAALAQSIQQMQGALSGTLAAQATALQQTLQAVLGNINQYGSAATQALMTQINTQLGDLSTSIQQQQGALQQQIQTLSGAADTASQQQLAALQTQLQQLNTAEAPVAAATTQAAQAQVTAVNIGEAQAKNQIQGQAQLQGFTGGSSMLANALAQAGISAQQAGAADVGQANIANTQAYQQIANQGANTQAAIANQLAQQQQAITGQGAQGQYNLAAALAQGQQQLLDTGATGKAAIANTVAGQGESAGNTAAEQQYANTSAGLQAQYNLSQALAQGQYGLTSTEAQQQQQNIQNQYGQSLQSALLLAGLPAQEAGSITSTDALQNAGLLNAQNALSWWNSPAQAPSPATTTVQAGNTGNQISAAGTGLLGAATSIGNSANWWQSPVTTPTSGATAPFTTPTIAPINTSLISPTP